MKNLLLSLLLLFSVTTVLGQNLKNTDEDGDKFGDGGSIAYDRGKYIANCVFDNIEGDKYRKKVECEDYYTVDGFDFKNRRNYRSYIGCVYNGGVDAPLVRPTLIWGKVYTPLEALTRYFELKNKINYKEFLEKKIPIDKELENNTTIKVDEFWGIPFGDKPWMSREELFSILKERGELVEEVKEKTGEHDYAYHFKNIKKDFLWLQPDFMTIRVKYGHKNGKTNKNKIESISFFTYFKTNDVDFFNLRDKEQAIELRDKIRVELAKNYGEPNIINKHWEYWPPSSFEYRKYKRNLQYAEEGVGMGAEDGYGYSYSKLFITVNNASMNKNVEGNYVSVYLYFVPKCGINIL